MYQFFFFLLYRFFSLVCLFCTSAFFKISFGSDRCRQMNNLNFSLPVHQIYYVFSLEKSLRHQHQLLVVSLQLVALVMKDQFFNEAVPLHIQTHCFISANEKLACVRCFISLRECILQSKKKKSYIWFYNIEII